MKHRASGKQQDTESDDIATASDLGRHIGFLIRKIYQKNQGIWQALCPDPQLTSVQFAVLDVVLRKGPCSLAEVGRAAAIDSATTRGVVDRLRLRRLIALDSDSRDRRKVIVRLQPAGERMVRDMQPVLAGITEATWSPLNPAERVALRFLLLKATEDDGQAAEKRGTRHKRLTRSGAAGYPRTTSGQPPSRADQ